MKLTSGFKLSAKIWLPVASIGLIAGAFAAWRQARPVVPAEYLTLKAVISRLVAHNSLGSAPISFSINSGSYAASLAEMRGLCKAESCDFYAQLNPYKSYGKDWDEISRQSYTLGDIGAWTTSSGTIEISRATFRAYGSHAGWLACTVAHEIAHLKRKHIFLASYYANNTIRSTPKGKQDKLIYAQSRKQELEADRDAALMMARAGYQGRICQDGLMFMHQSSGDGGATEPLSTHPGYDDRFKALTNYYKQNKGIRSAKEIGVVGTFDFDPADNLLSYRPSKR
jgi:Zn-dependent protease with chaperone function